MCQTNQRVGLNQKWIYHQYHIEFAIKLSINRGPPADTPGIFCTSCSGLTTLSLTNGLYRTGSRKERRHTLQMHVVWYTWGKGPAAPSQAPRTSQSWSASSLHIYWGHSLGNSEKPNDREWVLYTNNTVKVREDRDFVHCLHCSVPRTQKSAWHKQQLNKSNT